jgi:hypothetical protein
MEHALRTKGGWGVVGSGKALLALMGVAMALVLVAGCGSSASTGDAKAKT